MRIKIKCHYQSRIIFDLLQDNGLIYIKNCSIRIFCFFFFAAIRIVKINLEFSSRDLHNFLFFTYPLISFVNIDRAQIWIVVLSLAGKCSHTSTCQMKHEMINLLSWKLKQAKILRASVCVCVCAWEGIQWFPGNRFASRERERESLKSPRLSRAYRVSMTETRRHAKKHDQVINFTITQDHNHLGRAKDFVSIVSELNGKHEESVKCK